MNIQQKTKHWQSIFEQHQSSGLCIIGFCQAHKINVSTFYSWRKRIANKTLAVKSQQVIPFVIHEQPFTQSSVIKITTPNGYQVDFDSSLAHQVLVPLLKALQ
jgi:hypothetical protein